MDRIHGMNEGRIKLSDQLRRAVDNCGQTRYAISKATGIAESTLSRFMAGERGLPMKTLDKLADFLDLDIIAGKRRRAKG
jgi:transcriptional regulator with XRE-family HTH domain